MVCWYAGVLCRLVDVDFLVVFVLRVWCLLRVLFLAHSFLKRIHSMFLSA